MRTTRTRLAIAALLACGLLVGAPLGGCGGDGEEDRQQGIKRTERSDHAARAVAVIDSWDEEIVAAGKALASGDQEALAAALAPIEEWGGEGREEFLVDDPSPVSRAVIAAGDAWAEWAYRLRTDPPGRDYEKARRQADLAMKAARLTVRAAAAAGVDLTILAPAPTPGAGASV
jgi:hypothetical protein